MKSVQRQKVVPLVFLNIVLVLILLFVLNHYNIISFSGIISKKAEKTQEFIEDPFLLEKEMLKKQWEVLNAKEQSYIEKMNELKKKEELLTEKLKEAEKEIEIAKSMQKKQEEIKKNYEDRKKNVRDLALKIGNMPPKDGVALLEKMDPVLAVDVIKEMDNIAVERGKKSITDYLLSIMDKEKASTIIRLISRYPTDTTEENK
ncbi:MAG TPA: hypothetical protein PKW55_07350 [Spirochaetota bacterium]|nr:hypothetical protein [Spirochaetota bacterium]HOM38603.1 hypothetical protein [Spirochaetota bacterium]HPQ49740.1 hypothetical protein [Spirochaetota bacterium]